MPQQTYPLLKIVECGGILQPLMVITHFDPINHCQRPARDSERIVGAADSTNSYGIGMVCCQRGSTDRYIKQAKYAQQWP